jgi:hypothetical protein
MPTDLHTVPNEPSSAEPDDSRSPGAYDWSPFERDGVDDVVANVARKAAGRYEFAEPDDMLQEVRLLLAGRPELVETARSEPLGLLYHRLWCDVVDSLKGSAETAADEEATWASLDDADESGWSLAKNEVAHQEYAAWHDAEFSSPLAVLGVRDFSIKERLVIGLHHLLRWDDDEVDRRYSAMLYDAETAWQRANLTHLQRRAVVLILGRGLNRVEAARIVGVDESTMRRRFDRSLELLVAEVESWPAASVA